MEINVTDEFASTMQQLSAEAEKALPEDGREEDHKDDQFTQILRHFNVLNGRMLCLEERVAKRLEKGAGTETELAEQIRKMSRLNVYSLTGHSWDLLRKNRAWFIQTFQLK